MQDFHPISVICCEKRVADASVLDTIWFEDSKKDMVAAFLKSTEAIQFQQALEDTTNLINGFESPLGLELLSTVDWILNHDSAEPTVEGIKEGLRL